MDIYQIVAVGIVATVLSLTVKKENQTIAILISVSASILIFVMVLPNISAILEILKEMASSIDTSIPYATLLVKIIGIAYISELGASICADAGESAISSKIELAGKVIILTISSPIIFTLLQQVLTLLP